MGYGKIRGKVLDEETEQPIEKFKVVLRHTAGMHAFTSIEGEFLLDQLDVNHSVQRKPGLKGIVIDSNGKPIQGAEVVLGFEKHQGNSNRFYWGSFNDLVDGYMGLNFVQRVLTKVNGRFEFAVVDQQAIVAVFVPGFARQVRFLNPTEAQTLNQSQLKPQLQHESAISGVVEKNGNPTHRWSLLPSDHLEQQWKRKKIDDSRSG